MSFTGWHGNLTSFTCVIDHRWICKIADYGFQKFKQFGCRTSDDSSKWIAPEFTGAGTDFGSKEGDVYSFGAICQEVLLQLHSESLNDFRTYEVQPSNDVLDGKIILFKVCSKSFINQTVSNQDKDENAVF